MPHQHALVASEGEPNTSPEALVVGSIAAKQLVVYVRHDSVVKSFVKQVFGPLEFGRQDPRRIELDSPIAGLKPRIRDGREPRHAPGVLDCDFELSPRLDLCVELAIRECAEGSEQNLDGLHDRLNVMNKVYVRRSNGHLPGLAYELSEARMILSR